MRVGRVHLFCAFCGSLGIARALPAQGWPILVGGHVRVTAPTLGSSPVVGRVVERRIDALLVQRPGGDTIAVPMADVLRVEVSYGQRRHRLAGAIMGGASGAVIGCVVGASSNAMGPLALGRGGQVAVGAGMGSAGGAVIGAAIGALIRTERWHDAAVAPMPIIAAVGWQPKSENQRPLAAVSIGVSWLGY